MTSEEHDDSLAALEADDQGDLLCHVWLDGERVPLRLDPGGQLVYVNLASGGAVSLSDANDEVGLLAVLHPDVDDVALACRYVRLDGVEVVEVPTPDGVLHVPASVVPYDPRGGATVGRHPQ